MPDSIIFSALLALPAVLAAAYTALCAPRFFFAVYVVLSTRLFGFMPASQSLLVPSMLFVLDCCMILSVAILSLSGWTFSNRMVRLLLACVLGLTAFGILYPFFLGYSSIRWAVVDGKDMFEYTALAYLVFHSRRFDFDYFLRLFCSVGVGLTVVLVVGRVFHYCPPGYVFVWGTHVVHVHHSLYMSLAACLVASRILRARISLPDVSLFLLLAVGLLLQGHRSVTLLMLFVVSLGCLVRTLSVGKVVAILAVAPVVLGIGFLGDGRLFDTHVLGLIRELRDEDLGAIASRHYLNAERRRYMENRPLLGYGFIDETSSLGASIERRSFNRFDRSLGVVDSGYVDMRVRFGIVGMSAFCLVLGLLLLKKARALRSLEDAQTAMLLFLFGCFFVNYTLSVFTYRCGIGSICVAIHLLCRETAPDSTAECAAPTPKLPTTTMPRWRRWSWGQAVSSE